MACTRPALLLQAKPVPALADANRLAEEAAQSPLPALSDDESPPPAKPGERLWLTNFD